LEGRTYDYRVWSNNGTCDSACAEASITTLMAAPTDVQVTLACGGGIKLQWQANSTVHPAYSVQQLVNGTWTEVASVDRDPSALIPDTETATVVGSFDPSTQYQFHGHPLLTMWVNRRCPPSSTKSQQEQAFFTLCP
jgi:hypothetical protein